mgnify:CR=1 FL=1
MAEHYSITNNIRTLRFLVDEMTQQELASKVGVTRQTIMAIEKGKYSPSLEVAFKIALVFDKPFNEVFQYSKVKEWWDWEPGSQIIFTLYPSRYEHTLCNYLPIALI